VVHAGGARACSALAPPDFNTIYEEIPMSHRIVRGIAGALLAACVLGAGMPARAADAADQTAGQDVKDSANSAKSAAVKTGHKVKHGVKKGAHKAASKVDSGAQKVESKTPSE